MTPLLTQYVLVSRFCGVRGSVFCLRGEWDAKSNAALTQVRAFSCRGGAAAWRISQPSARVAVSPGGAFLPPQDARLARKGVACEWRNLLRYVTDGMMFATSVCFVPE